MRDEIATHGNEMLLIHSFMIAKSKLKIKFKSEQQQVTREKYFTLKTHFRSQQSHQSKRIITKSLLYNNKGPGKNLVGGREEEEGTSRSLADTNGS